MKSVRSVHHHGSSTRVRGRKPAERSSGARYRVQRHPRDSAPLLTSSRLRLILTIAAAATLYLGVTFVNRSPIFAIRHVRVTGLSTLLPEEAHEVQAAISIPRSTGFFRLNSRQVEEGLKRVPVVAEAVVTRRFPNGVDVKILPRVPVAIVEAGEDHWEVDRSGVAVRLARADQKLPHVVCAGLLALSPGQRIDEAGMAGALRVAALTTSGKPLGIAKIEVDQNADMCLNMVDSVAIRIGQPDQLDTKLALVHRIYDERPDIGAAVEEIDLRFPEAPACLPRGTNRTRRSRETETSAGRNRQDASRRDSTTEGSPADELSQGSDDRQAPGENEPPAIDRRTLTSAAPSNENRRRVSRDSREVRR